MGNPTHVFTETGRSDGQVGDVPGAPRHNAGMFTAPLFGGHISNTNTV